MKLLYNAVNGEIFYIIPDRDAFMFRHTTTIPLSEFEIDEVSPDNQNPCHDLYKMQGKRDINGLGKYYIQGGELYERDGWEEFIIGPYFLD